MSHKQVEVLHSGGSPSTAPLFCPGAHFWWAPAESSHTGPGCTLPIATTYTGRGQWDGQRAAPPLQPTTGQNLSPSLLSHPPSSTSPWLLGASTARLFLSPLYMFPVVFSSPSPTSHTYTPNKLFPVLDALLLAHCRTLFGSAMFALYWTAQDDACSYAKITFSFLILIFILSK